jgi:glycerophosphoryl diester phosphodiesterase
MMHDFRLAWKSLVLTDIVYKAIAFAVLTPLVGLVLRMALAASGRKILADQDILHFLLGPVGWIVFIMVNSAVLAVVVLEQAALMIVTAGAAQEKQVSVRQALTHTLPLTRPMLQIIARLLARALLTTAPFALALGGIYSLLLRPYDINYYLTEKPPAFWIAAILSGTLLAGLAFALLRVLLPAAFVLPVLLFEDIPQNQVMPVSRQRTLGQLRSLSAWVVAWMGITFVLSTLGTSLVGWLGKITLPLAHSSLGHALWVIGFMLILWALVNLGLSVLGVTSFAVMLVHLYRRVTGPEKPILRFDIQPQTRSAWLFRLSRFHWLLVLAVALMVTLTVGAWAILSIESHDRIEITAHRGASAAAPENSMAAVQQAIADRADWVEIDVQESADGEVLVIHDEDLKRLAGQGLKVWNSTARQLRQVDIGVKFAPEFAGQQIPTLAEVLRACKGKAGVIIELKHYGHAKRLEQRVIDLVEQLDMQDEIQIMSLKYDSIQKVRSLRPQWPVGLLSAVSIGDMTKINADFLAVSTRIATRRFIHSAHRREKGVYVWTVNDPIVMSTMISRGAKNIITDKPALAREVMRQRREMATVERLLLEVAIFFGAPPPSRQEDA